MNAKQICWAVLILASLGLPAPAADEPAITKIDPPEQGFFSKQVLCQGIPIKAHKDVSDEALREAYRRLSRLLEHLPEAAANLADLGAQLQIIGKDQQNSDLPSLRHWKGKVFEHRNGRDYTLDERCRGVGGLPTSCGEENLLKLPGDRYVDHRDICSHEFAHTLLLYGLSDNVRKMVRQQYKESTAQGLWKSYAGSDSGEYFAELTMWYFGSRGDYGRITPQPKPGREWLRQYDPKGFELVDSIYSGKVKVERIVRTDLPPTQKPEGELRSVKTDAKARLLFLNDTAAELSLYWIDFEGRRKSFGTIDPFERRTLDTCQGHPWLLAAPDGKTVGIYIPDTPSVKVTLK